MSSFGFSGTNAHVVLEEAPLAGGRCRAAAPRRGTACRCRRAPTRRCRRLAERYADALDRAGIVGRATSPTPRASGAPTSPSASRSSPPTQADARERCAPSPTATAHPDVHRGTADAGRGRWKSCSCSPARARSIRAWRRGLYETSPVFREVIDRCDALLGPDAARPHADVGAVDADAGDDAPIHETAWTQPALFAVEYALTAAVALVGHRARRRASATRVGEYVAACVAGVFTLEDGLRLIAERGRLMQALPPGGDDGRDLRAGRRGRRGRGADVRRRCRSPRSTPPTASSSRAATRSVDAVLAEFERRNVKGHRLFVSLAAHSPLVEPALDAMEACAGRVADAAAADSGRLEPDRLDAACGRRARRDVLATSPARAGALRRRSLLCTATATDVSSRSGRIRRCSHWRSDRCRRRTRSC